VRKGVEKTTPRGGGGKAKRGYGITGKKIGGGKATGGGGGRRMGVPQGGKKGTATGQEAS